MTAETAVVLPVLVLVTVALAWMISVGLTQVRALDAAREAARSAARSDDPGHALGLARRVAPRGSHVSLSVDGDTVVARVASPVAGAGRLLGLVSYRVRAEAVAVQEPAW